MTHDPSMPIGEIVLNQPKTMSMTNLNPVQPWPTDKVLHLYITELLCQVLRAYVKTQAECEAEDAAQSKKIEGEIIAAGNQEAANIDASELKEAQVGPSTGKGMSAPLVSTATGSASSLASISLDIKA